MPPCAEFSFKLWNTTDHKFATFFFLPSSSAYVGEIFEVDSNAARTKIFQFFFFYVLTSSLPPSNTHFPSVDVMHLRSLVDEQRPTTSTKHEESILISHLSDAIFVVNLLKISSWINFSLHPRLHFSLKLEEFLTWLSPVHKSCERFSCCFQSDYRRRWWRQRRLSSPLICVAWKYLYSKKFETLQKPMNNFPSSFFVKSRVRWHFTDVVNHWIFRFFSTTQMGYVNIKLQSCNKRMNILFYWKFIRDQNAITHNSRSLLMSCMSQILHYFNLSLIIFPPVISLDCSWGQPI